MMLLTMGCFAMTGFLAYMEQRAADSYVLARYLKFFLENQLALTLGFSVAVLFFHYQVVATSRMETKCRVLVGDRLMLIKFRYGIECIAILAVFCAFAVAIQLSLGLDVTNTLFLTGVLASYAFATACLVGGL